MFCLSCRDLQKRILGAGDGPASFNSELTKQGGEVVSVDPIYQFGRGQIQSRIEEVYPEVMNQVRKNESDFVWESISSPKELGQIRMAAMDKFLNDYEGGKIVGRYLNASLPTLPFVSDEFDLALCSHYLFLYSSHISLEQHLLSMLELCRVAKEVRVYPLVSLNGTRSKHLSPVRVKLSDDGFEVTTKKVAYQFQEGASEMLVVRTKK